MVLVKVKNLNGGKRNPLVKLDITGHLGRTADIDGGFPPTVWLHLDFGVMRGGFHTDIKSAENLRKVLDQAIKLAKEGVTKQ